MADNDDTLRKVLHSVHNGRLKRSVSYKISLGFRVRRVVVSRSLLMNKLRPYINLLIVIQIGFLNRRLEVIRLFVRRLFRGGKLFLNVV